MRFLALLLAAACSLAAPPKRAAARRLAQDVPLEAAPDAELWRGAAPAVADAGPLGEPAPGHRTEIRVRWTPRFLYVHYTCPYALLHLNEHPVTDQETNKLWDHDVAEIFVGWDFEKIWQYKEFQVSPQGEWVDLDIDRKQPLPEGGWRWNSGYEVAARIDAARRVWYGAMKIPMASIAPWPPAPGRQLRVNFYRLQGPPPQRAMIAWSPTGARNYHVPEAFGLLRLEE
jgi:hypothetical protein